MAGSAIVMVLGRLLARHGVKTGIRMAQRLGFDNRSIKKAFKSINAEQKKIGLKEFKMRPKRGDFQSRKAERKLDMEIAERNRALSEELAYYNNKMGEF
tara:strand:- start:539 stop:835 length:297 start_codon:yes stop_codon:yes gene_type:complete